MLRVNCISVKCMWVFSPCLLAHCFGVGRRVQTTRLKIWISYPAFQGHWSLRLGCWADTNFSFNHSWNGTHVSVQFNILALTFPSHCYFWWLCQLQKVVCGPSKSEGQGHWLTRLSGLKGSHLKSLWARGLSSVVPPSCPQMKSGLTCFKVKRQGREEGNKCVT